MKKEKERKISDDMRITIKLVHEICEMEQPPALYCMDPLEFVSWNEKPKDYWVYEALDPI
jgi:hypothetical protein